MTPLSNLLKSAAGTCRLCGQKAGVLTRDHSGRPRTFDTGFQEMVALAADVARDHNLDKTTLRLTLAEIADRSLQQGRRHRQTGPGSGQ